MWRSDVDLVYHECLSQRSYCIHIPIVPAFSHNFAIAVAAIGSHACARGVTKAYVYVHIRVYMYSFNCESQLRMRAR